MKVFNILGILLILNISYSQDTNLENFFLKLKNKDFHEANSVAKSVTNSELSWYLQSLNTIIETSNPIALENQSPSANSIEGIVLNLIKGYNHTFNQNQNNLESFQSFNNALKTSQDLEINYLTKTALIGILDLFKREIFIGSKQFAYYLNEFEKIKSDKTDEALYIMYRLTFASKMDDDDIVNKDYFEYSNKLDSIFMFFPRKHSFYPHYLFEKAIQAKVEKKFDIASNYFRQALKLTKNRNEFKSLESAINWQFAYINYQFKNSDSAIYYLEESNKLSSKLRDRFYNDRLLSLILANDKKFDSAYYYLNKSLDVEYLLGYKNNTLESSILSVQNETDRLKINNLQSEAKRKQNRNLLFGSLGLLLFSVITFLLVQKSTKRKQLIAEQEKILETQKLTTALKEQELMAIDAMIEGQEKERQRIANDLHDDLGGLMATVKLHFNALKDKKSPELFNKTNTLIDEAYQKVRSVAHAKNSGVIAKQGLLKAVNNMADKISATNKLAIEVIDHGLENRLENSLELTIFRIIQELVTNVIKHAEASEATIHLTQHEDSLNIMIEDNGKGFNPSQVTKINKGMGISSIDKRVEHLNGSMTIESEPNKGTNIIIDIPV